MLRITIARDGKTVKQIDTERATYVLGRDRSCDLVLDDRTASRRHAKLEIGEGGVYVEDLESKNGTLVSGNRVTRQRIGPGDTVAIGGYRISFEGLPGADEEPTSGPRGERPAETAVISAVDATSVGSGEDIRQGIVGAEAMAKRLSVLYELGQKLSGTLGIDGIADCYLDVLLGVFSQADRAIIMLEDKTTRRLSPFRMKQRAASDDTLKVSQTVIDTVLREKRAVLCGDTRSDARFKHSASLQDLRIDSVMCSPLLVSDKVLGMVEVDSTGGGIAFSEDDLRLLTGLASQVSIAIENARLYREIETSKRLAAIGQTVAGVAHCVKNVLNGIEGGLFIARRGLEVKDESKTGKGWDMLERNSFFLKALVLDMLDYSKDRPPEYTNVEPAEVFEEIKAFAEGRAAESGISLEVNLDSRLGPVRVDPKRIKRALLNIVSNALEATQQGGRVEITAERIAPDTFKISISDTGKGIPEDMLQTIFEPFYSSKGTKGTGLGLPVTRKIIEEHRGNIEVASTPGEGTAFVITLPTK